ncbi:javelin isoform X1 [Lasioglossum baleicum]|uniref:javelin isoform X1 n=1 Tax=Lasioglossum baleicum TaxID=434251 RepID=UPI003FCC9BCE
MGGVQSGTHTLGDALWVHERQRQKCHREGGRHEAHSAQSTQDRRKLLKRTRSLAVISEDESRQDREAHHFRLGQSTFDLPRRHQLIPRAKLIDRNSLKDRLSKSQQHLSDSYERFNEAKSYYSRSACGLHSIPPGLATFPDPLPYARPSRADHPDRLNILDWPESPRRYHSVQDLETVSGLVDIVEDNWPIEGNRSIDCIYTQVKRKRKEHRSLDSILFEDDGELEYFDVLNLLPLSNVRLEFDEEDARNNNLTRKSDSLEPRGKLKSLEYLGSRTTIEKRARSNATDEEKCTGSRTLERKSDPEYEYRKKQPEPQFKEEFTERSKREPGRAEAFEQLGNEDYCRDDSIDRRATLSKADEDRHSHRLVNPEEEEHDRRVEEAEDYKSIWISDTEEHEDMSRRPQVLKVVDNDVTKRRHRRTSPELDLAEQSQKDGAFRNEEEEPGKLDGKPEGADPGSEESPKEKADPKTAFTNAKMFIEPKPGDKDPPRNKPNEGRFERIVKGTSNILGKACSVVKGSLGFEARSESSDLGLGSESGSDTRRRSVDDGIEDDQACIGKPLARKNSDSKKSSLTRSKSCVDSIECHQDDGQEFDHVRYKIVKSNMFSKNMYNTGRGDVTYEGLMQYLREYSFQELLLDNNVVIIEPVRAETIERKPSTMSKTRSETTCKIAGAIQKKSNENRDRNCDSADGSNSKSPKQSSIKKHFFYHPIRVNRELIDEELPDPDTVRNVRRMFENTLKMKSNSELTRDDKSRKSVSMKDLSSIDDARFDEISEKIHEGSRSRCSSRAKDLTRLFENMEKSTSSNASVVGCKDELDSPRSESKTRIIAQSFEARSGHTSPSDSTSSKNKVNRYHHHHHHHHNWDAGSVSSGVSSDYPDTDPGSGVQCISSEDEEVDCHEEESNNAHNSSHYVSQDVLKKIRECGTSVTYYGGKVVNSSNGPLIAPVVENRFKCTDMSNDYVKFRLVKSNSCDSRLELTGRLVENHLRCRAREKAPDLSRYTIAETPSIEITTIEKQEKEIEQEEDKRTADQTETKREPPVVIGLEPKKEDNKEPKAFKADFKLGPTDDAKSTYPSRFIGSALTRWQVNENNWRTPDDFGKMEFEEFEVLEDSLNAADSQRPESS